MTASSSLVIIEFYYLSSNFCGLYSFINRRTSYLVKQNWKFFLNLYFYSSTLLEIRSTVQYVNIMSVFQVCRCPMSALFSSGQPCNNYTRSSVRCSIHARRTLAGRTCRLAVLRCIRPPVRHSYRRSVITTIAHRRAARNV